MKYYFIICVLITLLLSCSNQRELIHTNVPHNAKREDDTLKPHTKTVHGTTPKFVVFEESPIPIKKVPPQYPLFARNAGIEGQVIVRAEVLENGSVGSVEIVQSLQPGSDGLDECAIKAVKQWKFIPAKNQGKPVAVWITFPIRFDI